MEKAGARYDQIGHVYTRARQADPRIAAQIERALGGARRVLNVGAGAGSYEPADREVVALEPSPRMIAQRSPEAAPVVCGVAEALPFPDQSFDVVMCVLSLHHWSDPAAGLAELRRVACKQVLLHFEAHADFDLWIVREYFGESIARELGRELDVGYAVAALPAARLEIVPIPHDCTDGFAGAYWRRPERYLEADVWRRISSIAQLSEAARERGLAALRADLASGAWHLRHADLLERDSLDLGYRLLIAGEG